MELFAARSWKVYNSSGHVISINFPANENRYHFSAGTRPGSLQHPWPRHTLHILIQRTSNDLPGKVVYLKRTRRVCRGTFPPMKTQRVRATRNCLRADSVAKILHVRPETRQIHSSSTHTTPSIFSAAMSLTTSRVFPCHRRAEIRAPQAKIGNLRRRFHYQSIRAGIVRPESCEPSSLCALCFSIPLSTVFNAHAFPFDREINIYERT